MGLLLLVLKGFFLFGQQIAVIFSACVHTFNRAADQELVIPRFLCIG